MGQLGFIQVRMNLSQNPAELIGSPAQRLEPCLSYLDDWGQVIEPIRASVPLSLKWVWQ